MAIALHNDTTFDGNLKLFYQKYREDVFPVITPLFAQFQKFKSGGPRNMRWGGKGAVFDLVLGIPTGGHWSANGHLPDSVFRDERQATVNVSRFYVRRQFDKLAVIGSANRAAAYVTLAQKINEEINTVYRLGMQEGLHGDARNIKATVTNVSSTTVIDVANPYGVTGAGKGSMWIQKGAKIAVLDSTGATNRGVRTVASIVLQTAPDTYRITLSAAVSSMSSGDLIVSATEQDTAFNAGINGLLNITNRGGNYNDLHGVSAGTWAEWDATRMTAGVDTPRTEQLLESDLVELFMRVASRSGKNPMQDASEFVVVTTPGLKKSYVESVQGQRQLTLSQTATNLKGGYAATASCNGVPILDDPYCPAGTVYLLHLPSVGWIDAQDFNKVSYEGESAWRWVADRDAYETSSSIIFNTATTMRNAHGSIVGYTDVNRYTPGI
jgi:hypothetical protein